MSPALLALRAAAGGSLGLSPPSLMERYNQPYTTQFNSPAPALDPRGYVYIGVRTSATTGQFRSLDISDPSSPTQVSFVGTSSDGAHMVGFSPDRSYAFVGSSVTDAFQPINCADPTAVSGPTQAYGLSHIGGFPRWWSYDSGNTVIGQYTDSPGTLYGIVTLNTTNMSSVSVYNTLSLAGSGFSSYGSTAKVNESFVAISSNRIGMVNVTNRSSISLAWSLAGFNQPLGLAATNDHGFYSNGAGSILVYNTSGSLVDTISPNLGNTLFLTASGDWLFVSSPTECLLVDVSNPTNGITYDPITYSVALGSNSPLIDIDSVSRTVAIGSSQTFSTTPNSRLTLLTF